MSERFPDEVLKRAYVACDYALLSSVATDWADGLAAMRAVLEGHLAARPMEDSIGSTIADPIEAEQERGFTEALMVIYQRGPDDPPGNAIALFCPTCDRTAFQGHSDTCAASDGSPR
jgi:hypothetical protein